VNLALAVEPCPCGRMDKPVALWCCRCCYLEKEIGYALSELGRAGEWPQSGLARLRKLVTS
jgi:hypothetical protein